MKFVIGKTKVELTREKVEKILRDPSSSPSRGTNLELRKSSV